MQQKCNLRIVFEHFFEHFVIFYDACEGTSIVCYLQVQGPYGDQPWS